MKPHHCASLGILLLACLPLTVPAASSTNATHVLTSMRQATGGAQWDDVAAIVSDGTIKQEGMQCTVHRIVDVRDGRWRQDTHCPAYSVAEGIDARGAWKQDVSGQVHPLDSVEAKTLAITDRWLNRRGPLSPKHAPATLKVLKPATEKGTTYTRIKATPGHGRAVSLWIDPRDHRLARTVMQRSFQKVAVRYDDYRQVGGLELPFRISHAVGKPADVSTRIVTHYQVLTNLDTHALARPDHTVTDVHLPGGRTHVAILSCIEGLILVNARINGKGPFPFILDTGGHAILTPAAAEKLGLKTTGKVEVLGAGAGSTQAGYTHVQSVRLGAATIDDLPFLVMPLSPIVTDRGAKPPVAGLLGLEVLERFATTVDLDKHQLILRAFDVAKAPVDATSLPIHFTADAPLVHATLDGQRGIFQIDTGNPGPLMIFPDWAEDHGLAAYYLAGSAAHRGGGVGGFYTTHMAYIHSLKLGDLRVPGNQVGTLTPHGVNAVSNPSQAGNLDMTVWRNYRVTFNYQKGKIWLEPRTHYVPPQHTTTAGLTAVKLGHGAFTVLNVTANGAAAKAGLKRGSKIVAVEGVSARKLASLYLMKHIESAQPGSKLALTLDDGSQVSIALSYNRARENALHPSVP
ncbi:MAG TPA: aspartyl protease family protein [Oleiagrimonas sp.]|nr:aspartyl protease family protein [Oleiagrimonas sp.]